MREDNAKPFYQCIWEQLQMHQNNRKRERLRKQVIERRNALKPVQTETFSGVIKSGTATRFSIAGKDIRFDEKTWIFGDIKIGVSAKVTGVRDATSAIDAKKIIIRH
jgi:hypothetical protein